MKHTGRITLAGLMLALTVAVAPQKAAAGDITITKSSDHSSPVLMSSRASGPISLTGLVYTIGSAIRSVL
jgi:type VI protein secretion system component Hcp